MAILTKANNAWRAEQSTHERGHRQTRTAGNSNRTVGQAPERSWHAMLILTRRVGESFLIGDDVWVTVLHVRGSQVRLGVTAPSAVPVQREERTEQGHLKVPPAKVWENP